MIRFFTICFCVLLALNLYVNFSAADAPEYVRVTTVPTFDETVRGWAQELSERLPDVQVTETMAGNCLPVAVELQKLIIDAGHDATIIAVMPHRPPSNVGHAMVLYNSEMYGDMNSVIDNGYATNFDVQPRATLYDGTFGQYRGICTDPEPLTGSCSVVGLPQESE